MCQLHQQVQDSGEQDQHQLSPVLHPHLHGGGGGGREGRQIKMILIVCQINMILNHLTTEANPHLQAHPYDSYYQRSHLICHGAPHHLTSQDDPQHLECIEKSQNNPQNDSHCLTS